MNSQYLCCVLLMYYPKIKEFSLLVSNLKFLYAQVVPSYRKSKHVRSNFFAALQAFCKTEALLEKHTDLYSASCKAQAQGTHIIVQKAVMPQSNLRLFFKTSDLQKLNYDEGMQHCCLNTKCLLFGNLFTSSRGVFFKNLGVFKHLVTNAFIAQI